MLLSRFFFAAIPLMMGFQISHADISIPKTERSPARLIYLYSETGRAQDEVFRVYYCNSTTAPNRQNCNRKLFEANAREVESFLKTKLSTTKGQIEHALNQELRKIRWPMPAVQTAIKQRDQLEGHIQKAQAQVDEIDKVIGTINNKIIADEQGIKKATDQQKINAAEMNKLVEQLREVNRRLVQDPANTRLLALKKRLESQIETTQDIYRDLSEQIKKAQIRIDLLNAQRDGELAKRVERLGGLNELNANLKKTQKLIEKLLSELPAESEQSIALQVQLDEAVEKLEAHREISRLVRDPILIFPQDLLSDPESRMVKRWERTIRMMTMPYRLKEVRGNLFIERPNGVTHSIGFHKRDSARDLANLFCRSLSEKGDHAVSWRVFQARGATSSVYNCESSLSKFKYLSDCLGYSPPSHRGDYFLIRALNCSALPEKAR